MRVVVAEGVVKRDERRVVFRMRVVMVAGEGGVLVVSGRLVAHLAWRQAAATMSASASGSTLV